MTFRFRDMGPYEFPVRRTQRGKRFIDPIECRNAVFDQTSGDAARIGIDDIYSAVDLYVMGLRTRCEWPYYVGQSARPLYRRVFEGTDKPTVYGSIIDEMPRSRPFIYLLPMVSTSGAQVQIFGKGKIWTAPKKVINHAEQALISQALHINPNLYNTMPRMAIERYLIDGTPTADLRETLDAKAFRSLLGHDVSTARSNAIEEIMQASERAVEAEGGLQHCSKRSIWQNPSSTPCRKAWSYATRTNGQTRRKMRPRKNGAIKTDIAAMDAGHSASQTSA